MVNWQATRFYSPAFFTFLSLLLGGVTDEPDVVTVGRASFHGNTLEQGIIQFLGVPYAAPPWVLLLSRGLALTFVFRVGRLRFQVPQAALSLSGMQKALTFGAACPQQRVPHIQGINLVHQSTYTSEDCEHWLDKAKVSFARLNSSC